MAMGSYLILDISTKFQLPKQYDSSNQCNCTFRFKWGENQYRCANSVKKETIFQDIEVTNFQMINCFLFFLDLSMSFVAWTLVGNLIT